MSDEQPHKLIRAAKEAVKVARCDHVLIIEKPRHAKLDRFFCTKCKATFYVPVEG